LPWQSTRHRVDYPECRHLLAWAGVLSWRAIWGAI
jgi:hypothetical protein